MDAKDILGLPKNALPLSQEKKSKPPKEPQRKPDGISREVISTLFSLFSLFGMLELLIFDELQITGVYAYWRSSTSYACNWYLSTQETSPNWWEGHFLLLIIHNFPEFWLSFYFIRVVPDYSLWFLVNWFLFSHVMLLRIMISPQILVWGVSYSLDTLISVDIWHCSLANKCNFFMKWLRLTLGHY